MTTPGSSKPPGDGSGGEGPGSQWPVARVFEGALWSSRLVVLVAVVFGLLLALGVSAARSTSAAESPQGQGPGGHVEPGARLSYENET